MRFSMVLLHLLFTTGIFAEVEWTIRTDLQLITEQVEISAQNQPASITDAKWIQQPLDHFNKKEKRTWKMRYFENVEFWKKGGPVYLYITGEGRATPFLEGLSLYSIANETNGAIFGSEHRYYGESIPLDMSVTKNLKYLSSRQALADLSRLIQMIKSSPQFKNSKVIAVGGSYAGNLAAWMRLKYPNQVHAAWSSSAPVLAKKNFQEFFADWADDLQQNFRGCFDKISQTFSRYDQLLRSADGIRQLKKEENICEETDMSKPLNKASFFYEKILSNPCGPTNPTPNCNDREFSHRSKTITDYMRAWWFQTCTEFGYFKPTTNDKPFTKNLILDYYVKTCALLFGPEFDEKRIDKGIADTNKQYGGLKPKVTRVVFVNGSKDQWRLLGITKNLSKNAPARVIPDGLHGQDILREREQDSKEVIETRTYVKNLIISWLASKN